MNNSQNSLILPEMVGIWQETLHWQPDENQTQLFQRLYEEILLGNSQLNLTRITEPTEFWEKHLWDSLRGVLPCLESLTSPQRAIDIGTGAGFPGVPMAIALPQFSVTLLDSTRKKINFLEMLLGKLGIKNATPVTGRAESLARQLEHRQAYDIAVLRAVAPAHVCAEYALPLLKMGGLAILYRGHWTDEEMDALQSVVERLGGAIESIERFTTPISDSVRHCLYLRSYLSPKEVPIKQKDGSRKKR